MKQNHKIFLTAVLIFTIAALCLFSFCACNGNADSNPKSINVTIGTNEYSLVTTAEYLHGALLQLEDEGKIEYVFSDSSYGVYITSLSGLDTSAENSFVAVYHNIDDSSLIDYSGYASPAEVSGTTYNPSYVGVSSLPVVDGAKYLLAVSSY